MRVSIKRAQGFTLLEVLVVLAIGGLLVGLASLTLTRNPRSDLLEQAQRLALVFETAGDEAQLRNAPIMWEPVNGGYRFDVRSGGRWAPITDSLLGTQRWQVPLSGVAIRYPGERGTDNNASRLFFGTESISRPATVTLYSDVGAMTIRTDGSGRFDVVDGAAGAQP